jgi:hypothetical protein
MSVLYIAAFVGIFLAISAVRPAWKFVVRPPQAPANAPGAPSTGDTNSGQAANN